VYTPAAFAVDEEFTQQFLSSIIAADLVTITEHGLLATFLPVLYEGTRFISHMARNNEQWKLGTTADALLIAHGANAYISPTWYAATAEHGRVVPTFNYSTAHIYGEIRVHDDAEWVDAAVRTLTLRHEGERAAPWTVDDPPEGFIDGQLRAIVGLEFSITRVELKHKMSQNRPGTDTDGIVRGLIEDGQREVAELVRVARRPS
jgi:transcriptional regulator